MSPPPVVQAQAETPSKPRNRRLRLWLAMGAGLLGLLCLGGAGIAVILYDEETKIERAEPDAVVNNFLSSYLVHRDDKEAGLYQCESGGDFAEIAAYRADITDRERSFSTGIDVSWGSLAVTVNGDRATVATDLIKSTANGTQRITNPWHFTLVDRDGWRVCGAAESGS